MSQFILSQYKILIIALFSITFFSLKLVVKNSVHIGWCESLYVGGGSQGGMLLQVYILFYSLHFTSFSRACTAITLGPGRDGPVTHKPSKRRSDPCSYGPISLLCCLSKVPFMTKRLMSWPENTDKLLTEQSSLSLPKPFVRLMGTIFLDIEKAFDRVWHNGLRYELLHMKAPALLLRWISSFQGIGQLRSES